LCYYLSRAQLTALASAAETDGCANANNPCIGVGVGLQFCHDKPAPATGFMCLAVNWTAETFCTTVGAGDFDRSGRVGVNDVLSVLSAFGQSGTVNDLDQSGTVDVNDVLEILSYFHVDTTTCL
jgi:hypothetical protein